MIGSYRSKYLTLSASGQVMASEGWLSSFFVNSVSGGSIALYDATSATGTAVHTITPTVLGNYAMDNEHFKTGCYCAITGTINVTFRTLEQ